MTHPTKAICPILLEDYRKITVEKKGDSNFFTSEMIKNCMKKVKTVDIHQSIMVNGDLEIRPYYAGHVLGAAMFYARVGQESVVYSGDYNMTPDRHLGAAWIDKVRPNILITETTYFMANFIDMPLISETLKDQEKETFLKMFTIVFLKEEKF